MPVDIRLGVLHGNGPLLVPPIWLREDTAIDHSKPVVAPKIDIDFGPIAIVANLLRIEHQRAIDPGTGDVSLQAGFLDDSAIAFGEFSAEIADVGVSLSREDFAESREPCSHGHAVGVVRAAVEDFVLRNEIHDGAAG